MSTQPVADPGSLPKKSRTGLIIAAIVVTALVTFGITALAMNILQRKTEALTPYNHVVEIGALEADPAVWGQNFPQQYEDYLRTSEMQGTKYAGAHSQENEPSEFDPRTIISTSRIEEDTRLQRMWNGYAFATDYRHARGHAYMLEDQRLTQRVTNERFKQPGACLNCHASTLPIMDELGDGDMEAGYAAMNKMPYLEATQYAEHPVSCLDCHDPDTMELRITRPSLINALRDYKAHEGIENYDVNRDATNAEMRTYVCAQCHVEYYFKGEEKELTFPWANGLTAWDVVEYYDEAEFTDWTHAETGASMLKAQHPEFEVWSQGIHSQAGVSCADCHMPYKRDGAAKVSDHWLRSPLLMVNESCGTCHSEDEEEMTERVHKIQDNFVMVRDQTMNALVSLIDDIVAAQEANVPAERLDLAREYQRKASFFMDYAYSENSYGFHAPQYALTVMHSSQNYSRMGQLALQGMPQADIERQFEGTTVPYGGEEPGHAKVVNPGLVDSAAVMDKVIQARAAAG